MYDIIIAEQIAEELKTEFEPYCERIEIGGSIRRKKPEPNDIELVCIPKHIKIGSPQLTLTNETVVVERNHLFDYIAVNYEGYVLKMGEKYTQIEVHRDHPAGVRQYIKVDIFTATFRTWGYIFMLRTGPAEFSKFVVTELKKNGFTMDAGEVFHHGTPFTVPSEDDLFFLLGIDWIKPEHRFNERS